MKCREFEANLTEYLDDCLAANERRLMDQHLLSCDGCMAAHEEAEFAWSVLHEASPVEPPPQLIADIIHDTIGIGSGALAPAGGGMWGFLQPILNPFLEPRFVMGMAMTVVSFSMLSYHGQRAFENWRTGEPSALAQMASSTSESASGAWQRLTDMATAAQDFYELQIGAEDPVTKEGSN